jgi:hypothetical protein
MEPQESIIDVRCWRFAHAVLIYNAIHRVSPFRFAYGHNSYALTLGLLSLVDPKILQVLRGGLQPPAPPRSGLKVIRLKELSIIIQHIMEDGDGPDVPIPICDVTVILWNILQEYGPEQIRGRRLERFTLALPLQRRERVQSESYFRHITQKGFAHFAPPRGGHGQPHQSVPVVGAHGLRSLSLEFLSYWLSRPTLACPEYKEWAERQFQQPIALLALSVRHSRPTTAPEHLGGTQKFKRRTRDMKDAWFPSFRSEVIPGSSNITDLER